MMILDLGARPLRAARGVAASSVAITVALAAHLVAGGRVPSLPLVVAVLVVSWPPSIALIGRRLSSWRQGVVIVGAEFLLHGLFLLESGSSRALAAPAMPGMATAVSSSAMTTSSSAMAGMAGPAWLMWLGHAVAAVLTLVAWRWGERTFWGLLELAVRAMHCVSWLRAADLVPLVRRVRVPAVAPRRPASRAVVAMPRRGPPVLSV